MKKSLVTLAVLGLFASGAAMADSHGDGEAKPIFSFSGNVGFGLSKSNRADDRNADDSGKVTSGRKAETKSVNEGSPGFGITDADMSIKLANITVFGDMEVTGLVGIGYDSVARGSNVFINDRYLTLKGSFGSLRGGTWESVNNAMTADISGASLVKGFDSGTAATVSPTYVPPAGAAPTGTLVDGTANGVVYGGVKASANVTGLSYTTPELFPGMTVGLSATSGTSGTFGNVGYSVAGTYKMDAIYARLALKNINTDYDKADSKVGAMSLNFDSSYDLGVMKVAFAYYQEMTKRYDATLGKIDTPWSKNATFVLGLSAPFGDSSLGAAFALSGRDAGMLFGFNHKLGKNTKLNVSAGLLGDAYMINAAGDLKKYDDVVAAATGQAVTDDYKNKNTEFQYRVKLVQSF